MIFLPPFHELSMYGVIDAGVPNRERICLRPTEPVELAQFGILAGVANQNGVVTPVSNLFFWFGDVKVTPPTWLIVFTGKGQTTYTPTELKNGATGFIFYWNLDTTIFNLAAVVPVAFRISEIVIGQKLPFQHPQIAGPPDKSRPVKGFQN